MCSGGRSVSARRFVLTIAPGVVGWLLYRVFEQGNTMEFNWMLFLTAVGTALAADILPWWQSRGSDGKRPAFDFKVAGRRILVGVVAGAAAALGIPLAG